MIRRGEPWGGPTDRVADAVVDGGDADLAAAATGERHPTRLLAFAPTRPSDLARTLGEPGGRARGGRQGIAVPVDLLELRGDGIEAGDAVGHVLVGAHPTRTRWWTRRYRVTLEADGRRVEVGGASGVVVANTRHVGGSPLAPRAHPGDGLADVQVYALARPELGELRRRARRGDHLPHPAVIVRRAREVRVVLDRPAPVQRDGHGSGHSGHVQVVVRSGSLELLL